MKLVLLLPLLALVTAGCIDAPSPRDAVDAATPDTDMGPEPTLWPGYCYAENELDGMEGPDGRRTAQYDEAGLLTRDEFDSDLDGDSDVVTTYSYDTDDRLIEEVIDRYADGTPDEVHTYEWDDQGRMTRETWDTDADGAIDMDIAYQHDADGRRVRGEGQADDDPEPELVLRFDYQDGRLAVLYIDGLAGPADGAFDRIISYAYDEAGNLTYAFFDLDGDGIPNLVVTYNYDCWS